MSVRACGSEVGAAGSTFCSAVAAERSFCNVHAFLSYVSPVAITSLSQSLNIAVRWKLFDLASGLTFYSWTLQAFESLLKIVTGIQTCKQTTSNPTKARCRDEKLDGPDVSVTASRNSNPRGSRRPQRPLPAFSISFSPPI